MKQYRRGPLAALLGVIMMAPLAIQAAPDNAAWQQLLNESQHDALERRAREEAREAALTSDRSQRAQQLSSQRRALAQAEARRQQLEDEQAQLENQLEELQQTLTRESGHLGEVFGAFDDGVQQLQSRLDDSFVTVDQPQLNTAVQALANQHGVPDAQDLSRLWQLHPLIWQATGEVAEFKADYTPLNGAAVHDTVARVGDFDLVSHDGAIRRSGQLLIVRGGQPSEAVSDAAAFIDGDSAALPFDPARGLAHELNTREPSLLERLQQGGAVGYVIVTLGVLGLLIAIVQGIRLTMESQRMRRQHKAMAQPTKDNVLGRVMLRLPASGSESVLENALDEALLREMAPLERGLSLIKLLAAIAPLLGLLGTVAGMIGTFQAITVFGAGEPRLMAGGISQALVTTVLGLITAVPLLFAHLLLQGRARRLSRLIEAEGAHWLVQRLSKASSQRQSAAAEPVASV